MQTFDQIDKIRLRELLRRNWMTHDGMWFYHCLQECGIEKTNKVNKAAVRCMGQIEVKRIKKALDIDDVKTFYDLQFLIKEGFEIIRADFMKFNLSFPSHNVFQWDMPNCFAFEGIKMMGAIEHYQCGIIDRVLGWFDTLKIEYSYAPHEEGCLLQSGLHPTGWTKYDRVVGRNQIPFVREKGTCHEAPKEFCC